MNIYVGNLSYKVQETELSSLFEEFGEVVSVKIIQDQETGRSRGFAFVEMASQEDAEKAIEELNDTVLMGRNLVVNTGRKKNKGDRRFDGNKPRYRDRE
jgi:cold-inducible RNA-binding protein